MKFLRTCSSCILSLALVMSNVNIVKAIEEGNTSQYETSTQQSNKVFDFTVNDIDCNSTKIVGTGLGETTVVAEVEGKEIGRATVNKRGRYEISIPRQKTYTEIVVRTITSYVNLPPKTITVGFTIDGKVKSTSKIISGRGAVNAEVKAYVGNKQIGKTSKVNSDGRYKLDIPTQKTDTIITVQMSKYGVKLKNKTTVVSFENPPMLIHVLGKVNVVTPTSNLNLIIGPTVKTAINFVNPYVGAGLVAIDSTIGKPIDKSDIDILKNTFSEMYEATIDEGVDKVLKSLDQKTLSYFSNIAEVAITFNEIESKLEYDTTDYELNKIYEEVISDSVASHNSVSAIAKYNYAKTVLNSIRKSKDIELKYKDKNTYYVYQSDKGRRKLEILRDDLNKIEVEFLSKKYKDYEPTINPVLYNDTKITGMSIPGTKVKASINGKTINTVNVDARHRYTINIPKQPVGTKIKLQFIGNEYYNSKTYKYYDKTFNIVVGKAKINKLIVNKIYSTSSTVTGNTLAGAEVKAYVDKKLLGKSIADKYGNYKISIKRQTPGTNIIIEANKKNYTTKYSSPIKVLGKIDTLTVNEVYSDTTVLMGKTLSGAEVKVYVYKKQIGKTTVADKKGDYTVTIPKQSIGTTIEIKSNKKNYISKNISVKVQNKNLYPFIKNEKVGYMDQNGNVIIKPKFNYFYDEHDNVKYAGEFYDGIAKVYTDDKRVRYINTKGEYITDQIYDGGGDFSEGLAVVIQNGKYKYINKTGKVVIDRNFDQCWEFSEGLAVIKCNGKYGYINQKGQIVIRPQYQEARNFTNGYALVTLNNKLIIIDKNGNNKIKNGCIVYSGHKVVGNGMFLSILQGKFVFLDINNRNNIKVYRYKSGNNYIGYDEASLFEEGLAPVSINEKWGCVDTNGKLVIPMKFDWIDGFKDGLSIASLNNKVIVINKSGKVVGKLPHCYGCLKGKIFQIHTPSGYDYYDLNGDKINIKI